MPGKKVTFVVVHPFTLLNALNGFIEILRQYRTRMGRDIGRTFFREHSDKSVELFRRNTVITADGIVAFQLTLRPRYRRQG